MWPIIAAGIGGYSVVQMLGWNHIKNTYKAMSHPKGKQTNILQDVGTAFSSLFGFRHKQDAKAIKKARQIPGPSVSSILNGSYAKYERTSVSTAKLAREMHQHQIRFENKLFGSGRMEPKAKTMVVMPVKGGAGQMLKGIAGKLGISESTLMMIGGGLLLFMLIKK